MKVQRSIFFVAVLILALLTPAMTMAQESSSRYFEETGYTVEDSFLSYWNEHGGLRIFGLPITEVEVKGDLKVQQFERARFELHPDGVVRLGHVGVTALGLYDIPEKYSQYNIEYFLTGDVRFFPETGYTVTGVFVDFWDNNGGLEIFGYPISPGFYEDGIYFQYFERARFELRPNNDWIYLGLLGVEEYHGFSFMNDN